MPFDGIVVKGVIKELRNKIVDTRIEKIFQPEKDEIILILRGKGHNEKLLISANASFPRIHITKTSKDNPLAPPMFCMLLRKYLSGGKIIGIEFYDYERIISISIESTNELGDLLIKKLIVEIMGKHSNIILVNSDNKIIDAIFHIDSSISSVREIMPARMYVLPPSQNKISPENLKISKFLDDAKECKNKKLESYLLENIKGFSPLVCKEICYLSNLDPGTLIENISKSRIQIVANSLENIVFKIKSNDITPLIIFEDEYYQKPIDFYSLKIESHKNVKFVESISEAIEEFYYQKDKAIRKQQKTAELLKTINNIIARLDKKVSIFQKNLKELSNREQLKLFGELILANLHAVEKVEKQIIVKNYYSENLELIKIPIDENISLQANSQKYFKKYAKAKAAYLHTTRQLEEAKSESLYLEGVKHLLSNCMSTQEIEEVRQELIESSYIINKSKSKSKINKNIKVSAPMHFKSSDGYDIFVGKNNKQNDLLTLKTAASNDMWLHTKNIPGSHVIIKKFKNDIPDTTLYEAAIISAFYSKASLSSNVEVDYTPVKNVKKPSGAKLGMVIYNNYNTLVVNPNEEIVKKLKVSD